MKASLFAVLCGSINESLASDHYKNNPWLAKATVYNFIWALVIAVIWALVTNDAAIVGFMKGLVYGGAANVLLALTVKQNRIEFSAAVDAKELDSVFVVITLAITMAVVVAFSLWPVYYFGGEAGGWASFCIVVPAWSIGVLKARLAYNDHIARQAEGQPQ